MLSKLRALFFLIKKKQFIFARLIKKSFILKYLKGSRDARQSEDDVYLTMTSNNVLQIDKSCQFSCERMKQDMPILISVLVRKYPLGVV